MTKEAGSGWRVEASTYKHSRPTGLTSRASTVRFFSPHPLKEAVCLILWNHSGSQQVYAVASGVAADYCKGALLDPSNWLWQQREMDKWETPPEWPDDWGRNEETCSESQSSVGKWSFRSMCFIFSNQGLGLRVTMHLFWFLLWVTLVTALLLELLLPLLPSFLFPLFIPFESSLMANLSLAFVLGLSMPCLCIPASSSLIWRTIPSSRNLRIYFGCPAEKKYTIIAKVEINNGIQGRNDTMTL